jgi:hypothetical protein
MVTAAEKQKAAKVPVWQGVFAYFSRALEAVGNVSKFGAAKHNNGNLPTKWRDYPADVYADALARHILVENGGELYDSESNMLHACHEAWNALARLEKLLETYPLVNTGLGQSPLAKVPTPSTPHNPSCICRQCIPDGVRHDNFNR